MPPCPSQRLMKWSKELKKDKALYRLLKHILQKVLLLTEVQRTNVSHWAVVCVLDHGLLSVTCGL